MPMGHSIMYLKKVILVTKVEQEEEVQEQWEGGAKLAQPTTVVALSEELPGAAAT